MLRIYDTFSLSDDCGWTCLYYPSCHSAIRLSNKDNIFLSLSFLLAATYLLRESSVKPTSTDVKLLSSPFMAVVEPKKC
jgi:hypothetical protein